MDNSSPPALAPSLPEEQQPKQQQRQKVLLVTSNVGSLFGEKAALVRKYWLDQISRTVAETCPVFFALHLQESGGKNYRQHSCEMHGLVDELQRKLDIHGYTFSRSFLDIEHELVEEFTALSSLYFIHCSAIANVWMYNFRHRRFVPIVDELTEQKSADIVATRLNRSGFARKEKFPKEFWTTFRWSRKGFLHTRWKVGSTILDLVNIHLFHDESNLNFLENPSEYSNNRRRALLHTLDKFKEFNGGSMEGDSNCFMFGDFNFRLDLGSLVKRLTSQTSNREIVLTDNELKPRGHSVSDSSSCGGNVSPSVRMDDSEDSGLARTLVDQSTSSSETEEPPRNSSSCDCDNFDPERVAASMRRKNSVIEYFRPIVRSLLAPTDEDANKANTNWVLRLGKKRFEYCDSNWLQNEWKTYKKDDCEPKHYPLLKEFRLNFPPTYPWSEEPSCPNKFMSTRPPAWCDRVLFNDNARVLLKQDPQCEYRSFGREQCIGDHKPVMLFFSLGSSANSSSSSN